MLAFIYIVGLRSKQTGHRGFIKDGGRGGMFGVPKIIFLGPPTSTKTYPVIYIYMEGPEIRDAPFEEILGIFKIKTDIFDYFP